MIWWSRLVPPAAALALGAPAVAADSRFSAINFVNETGQTMNDLSIRRSGTQPWHLLTATPPRPGRGIRAVAPYSDIDCAFDLRATLEDSKTVVWSGVNLCEVKSLHLNRNDAGAIWVDYD